MSQTKRRRPIIPLLKKGFKLLPTYELCDLSSLEKISKWLHRPVDASALGIFRFLFGSAMLIDIAEERGGSQIDFRFGDEKTCHFPLFDFIPHFNLPVMGLVYLTMWIGALGIALGYNFRMSCMAFVVPYWYIFLLDKPAWNNHSYLFGLCAVLLTVTEANRFCSFDHPCVKPNTSFVPYWNYFLLKFQFFILYAYAGLKKLSTEWLSGYAMSSLSHHWIFAPLKNVLSEEMIDLLVVHWFTAIFDFTIPFFMTFNGTRKFATPFMICFHLMNSRLFSIGMFPWVCMAEVPLFFSFDWPHQLRFYILSILKNRFHSEIKNSIVGKTHHKISKTPRLNKTMVSKSLYSENLELACTLKYRLRSVLILMYCGIQLFLPYSHFITKGYNNWTDGLYGYSWDMMVNSYDTVLISVKVVDDKNEKSYFLEPFAFTHFDRWTKTADMAKQYAECIHKNIIREISKNPTNKHMLSSNISIYFDIWCSMNSRFQQRVFNPLVDILKAHWSPFQQTSWSLPLINELNFMRPKLKAISEDVLSWNNYSDVIFVADFPGLTLDNYISPDLSNITLTVIDGSVTYKNQSMEYNLSSGESISLTPGEAHQVTTTSSKTSCYQYTFINKTMESLKESLEESSNWSPDDGGGLLILWKEMLQRLANYKIFVHHIMKSVMFIVNKVLISTYVYVDQIN